MSRRTRSTENIVGNETCCSCVRIIKEKPYSITDFHTKTSERDRNPLKIYEILESLNILHYEIKPYEELNAFICCACKKVVLDFWRFKQMTLRKQKQTNHDSMIIKSSDNIKNYLYPHLYKTLEDFVSKNTVNAIYEDGRRLILNAETCKVKSEFQNEFIDLSSTDVLVKAEEEQDFDLALSENNDINYIDNEDFNEATNSQDIEEDFIQNIKNSNSDNDDEDNGFDNDSDNNDFEEPAVIKEEKATNCDDFGFVETNEKGVTKTVLENIEFIRRIPEYLVDTSKPNKSKNAKKPENWASFKQRTARAKGESYISRAGKVVKAKKLQDPCSNKCRYRCFEKITEAERKRNFDAYYQLADFALKKKFLFEHRTVGEPARRRGRSDNPRLRKYSYKYYLDTYNEDSSFKEQVKVCETMFVNTFDICKNLLRHLQKKIVTGKVEDLRGKKRRQLTEGHLEAIEHVKQFPYFHIENSMPLSQIYKLYQEICAKKAIRPVNVIAYRKLFSDYNESSFLKQDKVKCVICDEYYKANDEEQISLKLKYEQHIKCNEKCSDRARWRRSSQRKTARKRLLNEQKKLEKSKQVNELDANFDSEMDFI